MTTPTKQPILSQGILTPSCDITPTRETAREDDAYEDGFALTQTDCSEAPSSAPAVSVEHDATQNDGAEPSPSSPFTYDGDRDRAEPAAGGFVLLPRRRHRFPGACTSRPSCRTCARALETRAGCGKAVALDLITLKLLGRKSHIELLQHVFHSAEDAIS